jgi:hypothetical protein
MRAFRKIKKEIQKKKKAQPKKKSPEKLSDSSQPSHRGGADTHATIKIPAT